VHAQRNLRLLGRLELDVGGDELVRLKLVDGSERSLDAGGGFGLSAGLMYQTTFPLAIEATVGFKLGLITSPSGDVVFSRIPLDVVVSVADVGHRVGIGATTHLRPILSCNISGVCSNRVAFDTAYGLLCQYAYSTEHSNRSLELGARLTLMHYAVDNETFAANSIGVFVSGRL
jgi:hypothetical protein